jgi:hypothetical protein
MIEVDLVTNQNKVMNIFFITNKIEQKTTILN